MSTLESGFEQAALYAQKQEEHETQSGKREKIHPPLPLDSCRQDRDEHLGTVQPATIPITWDCLS